jgi:choline dehydrogenase
VGTCKMGVNDPADVDPQLHVHGLAGLRVVAAAAMPLLVKASTLCCELWSDSRTA